MEYYYQPNLTNESVNDNNIKVIDNNLFPLLKDLDGKIKYLSVLTQEDFGKIEPDNDTIYFINSVEDDVDGISNILDIAVSHTSLEDDTPEEIWVLASVEEVEEVRLYKAPLKKGQFTLIKKYVGYVDGSLTFDGVYNYLRGYNKSSLITNAEPFVVLINTSGELYAFPSLKYKTNGSVERKNKAIYLDGDVNNRVQTCSVDKGYGSEIFKGADQGVVIAYSKFNGNSYDLCYRQYGYANDNSTVKTWTTGKIIDTKPEAIFSVVIRRLSDYRLGLTYNFWETNEEGQRISRTEFRYSSRTYAGIAFHPEYIEISGVPAIGKILYGATRNDNIEGIEKPYLALSEEPEIKKVQIGNDIEEITGLTFKLRTDEDTEKGQDIEIELIDPHNPEDRSNKINGEEFSLSQMFGWEISTIYPYKNYQAENDPYFKNGYAKAELYSVETKGEKIILNIKGGGMPMTPFTITPSSETNENILFRYRASSFNSGQKNLSGWFALTEALSSTYGKINYTAFGTENHTFSDYNKVLFQNINFTIKTSSFKSAITTFNISGFHYSTNSDSQLELIEQRDTSSDFGTLSIGAVKAFGSGITIGVTNINV